MALVNYIDTSVLGDSSSSSVKYDIVECCDLASKDLDTLYDSADVEADLGASENGTCYDTDTYTFVKLCTFHTDDRPYVIDEIKIVITYATTLDFDLEDLYLMIKVSDDKATLAADFAIIPEGVSDAVAKTMTYTVVDDLDGNSFDMILSDNATVEIFIQKHASMNGESDHTFSGIIMLTRRYL